MSRGELTGERLPVDPDRADLHREAGGRRQRGRRHVVLAIGLAGAAGALARYGLTVLVASPATGFPWNTFLVNLTGSFALGLVLVVVEARLPSSPLARPIVATGFLGAYTTFSSYAVGADELVRHHEVAPFVSYSLGSLFAGLLAVGAGVLAGRLLVRRLGPLGWSRP